MDIPAVARGPCLPLASAFLGVSWITFGMRVYTRVYILRKFYAEDWAMVACMVLYTVFSVATIETSRLTELGTDKTIGFDELLDSTRWFLLTNLFYIVTTLSLKFSIGLFFLRVAVLRWRKVLIWTLLGFLTAISAWAFFLIIFHCGYFSSILELVIKRLAWQCVPPALLIGCVYSHAGIVAITDWTFTLLPISILRTTRIDKREKWVIGPLMMLASVGGIASLVRFKYCGALGIRGTDILTGAANLNIWSTVEASLGVSAANAACLRPLFREYVLPLTRYVYTSVSNIRTQSTDKTLSVSTVSHLKSNSTDKSGSRIVDRPQDEIPLHPIPVDANATERKAQTCPLPKKVYLPRIDEDIEKGPDEPEMLDPMGKSWLRVATP